MGAEVCRGGVEGIKQDISYDCGKVGESTKRRCGGRPVQYCRGVLHWTSVQHKEF